MSENFTSMREALLKARNHTEHELYSKFTEGLCGIVTHAILLALAVRYKEQGKTIQRSILLALNAILAIAAYIKLHE